MAWEDGGIPMPVAALSSQTQGYVLSQYLIFIPSTVSSDTHFSRLYSTVHQWIWKTACFPILDSATLQYQREQCSLNSRQHSTHCAQLIPHPSGTSCWQVQVLTQTTSLCSAIRLQPDSTNLPLTYKKTERQECTMNVGQTGYFMTLVWLQWTTNIPSKLKHCLLTTSKASTSRTTAKSATAHTPVVATAQTTTSSRVARCGIQEQLNVTMLHVFLILKQTANFNFEFKLQLNLLKETKWGSKNGKHSTVSKPKVLYILSSQEDEL